MGVDELVVVALGQRPELVAESLAADVVLARLAPAVTTPVAEGIDDPVHLAAVREDGSAFASGDLMSWIERQRRELPEGPHRLSADGRSERVTAILDQV